VVSPAVTRGLTALAVAGRIVERRRPFRRSDLRDCALVVAATGDRAVDDAVAALALVGR
jgi:siroheme synthase (precorrin-2 oxidase/ferrochelatase)